MSRPSLPGGLPAPPVRTEDTCLSAHPLSSLDRGVPCSLRFHVRTPRWPTQAHSPAALRCSPEPPGPTAGTARGAPAPSAAWGPGAEREVASGQLRSHPASLL